MSKSYSTKFIAILLGSIILFAFLGCKSHKDIKKLSSEIKCTKTVHFVWDVEGNFAKAEKRGNYQDSYASFFKGKKVDLKKIFIESVENLNKHKNGIFLFKEHHGFSEDSIIQVTVKLEKVVWNMGFSKLVQDAQMVYTVNGQVMMLYGSSDLRASKGLLESFEHAHLQFLMTVCA